MPQKRKHVTLTLEKKCEIIQELDKGRSIRFVADKFDTPRSTVADIKNKKHQITRYVSSSFQRISKMDVNSNFNIFY